MEKSPKISLIRVPKEVIQYCAICNKDTHHIVFEKEEKPLGLFRLQCTLCLSSNLTYRTFPEIKIK